jgi:hypothetical protein
MKKARYKYLLEKSISACISGIEIYNKPDFQFREEAFSVLMCTAWELLLKAKILKDNSNNFNSIVEKDFRIKKDGKKTKRKHPKLNRAGNPMTIGLTHALDLIRNKGNGIDTKCNENLMLLMEIRDNAVHFMNKTASFGKYVQEVGTATLKNFMAVATEWFRIDFAKFNFYLMPVSFYGPSQLVESISGARRGNTQLRNLERYIRTIIDNNPTTEDERFSVALSLNVKFVRSPESSAIKVRASNDPNAIPITLTEEDFLQRYPFDFYGIVDKLKSSVTGFKRDDKFYDIKRELEGDKKYCLVRLLDPKNPKSAKKKYYSHALLIELQERLRKKATETR